MYVCVEYNHAHRGCCCGCCIVFVIRQLFRSEMIEKFSVNLTRATQKISLYRLIFGNLFPKHTIFSPQCYTLFKWLLLSLLFYCFWPFTHTTTFIIFISITTITIIIIIAESSKWKTYVDCRKRFSFLFCLFASGVGGCSIGAKTKVVCAAAPFPDALCLITATSSDPLDGWGCIVS